MMNSRISKGIGPPEDTAWVRRSERWKWDDFLAAIVASRPYNAADWAADSTLTAILGRMVTYSGKLVTWDGGGKGGVFTLTYTAGAAVYVRNVTLDRRATRLTRAHQTLLITALSGNRVVFESGKAKRVLSNIHIWGALW